MNSLTPQPVEQTSQSLGGGSELTMVMPIKRGFVDHRDTITYALRLRRVLRTFNALRKISLESLHDDTFAGAVEKIQTVTAFNWAVIENERKLLLNVVFDRPWEPYIRKIARDAGPMLDLILCNCEDYVERQHSTDFGYPGFAAWARKHQVGVDFLYTSNAFSTTDDQRYYQALDDLLDQVEDPSDLEAQARRLSAKSPGELAAARAKSNPRQYSRQVVNIINAFYSMREWFPGDAKRALERGDSKDQWLLKRTARSLVGTIGLDGTSDLINEAIAAAKSEHPELFRWHGEYADQPLVPTVSEALPRDQIQGDILEPYRGITGGALLLIRLSDDPLRAATFIDDLEARVTTSDKVTEHGTPSETLNLFFTIDGLRRVGLDRERLGLFPKEFRDGMEARAGLLGDVRVNHPRNWQLPVAIGSNDLSPSSPPVHVPMQSVDIAVLLQEQGTSAGPALSATLKQRVDQLSKKAASCGARVLVVEPMYRMTGPHGVTEHFGFRDGISDPKPLAPRRAIDRPKPSPPGYSDEVPVGEFLLGYPNRHDDPVPARDPLLADGSFLVVRKLAQHVDRFDAALHTVSGVSPETVGAKMVGRNRNGTPLVAGGVPVTDNEFDYEKDLDGAVCPFQSHIRRSNPRRAAEGSPVSEGVPRIARRGFSYGPPYVAGGSDAQADRGMLFMAYNASIAEQFEVIQRWITGGNSTAIASRQSDPLLGLPRRGEHRFMRFEEAGKIHRVDLGDKPLVSLQWGVYLFCPSRLAVRRIAEQLRMTNRAPDWFVAEGEQTIKQLNYPAIDEDPSPQWQARVIGGRWKAFLEGELGPKSYLVNAVWAAIRARHNGVLRTPYGVLVACADQVNEVLSDEGRRFSVRENWDRMHTSIAETYLGIDGCPATMKGPGPTRDDSDLQKRYLAQCPVDASRYHDEAIASKPAVAEYTRAAAHRAAVQVGNTIVEGLLTSPDKPVRVTLLVGGVLAELAKRWFGMPDGEEMLSAVTRDDLRDTPPDRALCPFHFFTVSRYVFPPQPTAFSAEQAIEDGKVVEAAVHRFVRKQLSANQQPGSLMGEVYRRASLSGHTLPGGAEGFIVRTIIAMLNGFVAPTFANFATMIARWIETKELARHYHDYMLGGRAPATLERAIEQGLLVKSTPATVNRTVVVPTKIGGSSEVLLAGDDLVVSLQSAIDEYRGVDDAHALDIVFGGAYGWSKAPLHACPGKEMAIGTMTGILAVLFEHHLIKEEPQPLTLAQYCPIPEDE